MDVRFKDQHIAKKEANNFQLNVDILFKFFALIYMKKDIQYNKCYMFSATSVTVL